MSNEVTKKNELHELIASTVVYSFCCVVALVIFFVVFKGMEWLRWF